MVHHGRGSVRARDDAYYSGDLQQCSVSPWVAAVESMVKGHHGTVLNDSNVEKGELATKKKKPCVGTLQPALRVRVGSRVEISNPHPPRRQPVRQTRGFAQPVINPNTVIV
jgi:hypothetical protein